MKPFSSIDALCNYATTCAFFQIPGYLYTTPEISATSKGPDYVSQPQQPESGITLVKAAQDPSPQAKPLTPLEEYKSTLKSNDRRRLGQRPLFTYWIEQYLPRLAECATIHEGGVGPKIRSSSEESARFAGALSHLTRPQVVEFCQSWFGPSFVTEFEERKRSGLWEMQTMQFWARIRKELVDIVRKENSSGIETGNGETGKTGIEWGYVKKGLKRCILGTDKGAEPMGVESQTDGIPPKRVVPTSTTIGESTETSVSHAPSSTTGYDSDAAALEDALRGVQLTPVVVKEEEEEEEGFNRYGVSTRAATSMRCTTGYWPIGASSASSRKSWIRLRAVRSWGRTWPRKERLRM